MVAVKKVSSTRVDLDTTPRSTYPDFKEAKPPFNFAGFIFVCSNGTIPDLERRIFGLPLSHAPSVLAIHQGMPLFLFNYSTRCLCGVFEAASDGGLNIDPYAWENTEVRRAGRAPVSRYPAQVRVNVKFQRPPLDEETFRPVLDHVEGHKFRLELTAYQVKQLLRLFSVPEKEFFADNSKKYLQSSGTGTFMPESPRSAFKLDSDCYSECSSKGTYFGEDEGPEEDRAGKEITPFYLSHGEQHLCDGLNRLSFNDVQTDNYKVTDDFPEESPLHDTIMPSVIPVFPYGGPSPLLQQSALKRYASKSPYYCWPDTFQPKEASQVSSRIRDVDPAVNSHPVYPPQTGLHQPQSEDDIDSTPFIPSHLPVPFFGYENMIYYIPVQTQPRQLASLPLHAKGSEQKKLAGGPQPPKHALNSENHENILNSRVPKPYPQRHPIFLQGSQYGQILLPVRAAKPGPIYESNQMTTVLSPVLLSPYGQGVTLTHPQYGPMDSMEEHDGTINYPQLHAGGYHDMLHNGQFPLLLLPSVIPRMPPSPPSSAAGFIEAMHFNILQFARLTRPSAETQLFVESAIDCVRCCVRAVWPNADIEVYGSFATGLCLQHSDVDLAVVNAPLLPALVNMTTSQASSFLLRELGLSLKTAQCCESYNVIANASVPVLKCLCRPLIKLSDPSLSVPSIAIDITIGGIENSSYEWKKVVKGSNLGKLGPKQHTGGAAREYVLSKIRELPALAPLVLVMKSFLHHRGLSNVYLGGLGSFSLTLLLAYYLERVPLSGEGLPSKDLPLHEMSSPVIDFSDVSDEFEMPVMTNTSLDEFYFSYKTECVNWSLGEHYVRKAASVMDKVLALWEGGGVAYLGTLLLGFLRTFGFERDLAREKIVLKGIDGSPGGIFKRDNRHIALWIDDPLRPGVNIAAGSFGMCQVQAAFREMLLALVNGQMLTVPLHCNETSCQDLAAFGQLSQLSMLLMDANGHQHSGFEG